MRLYMYAWTSVANKMVSSKAVGVYTPAALCSNIIAHVKKPVENNNRRS